MNGATGIAENYGVSERIISITIVVFGTILPKLTASVIAALKKETDISIGNIIGFNIFNIMRVLGITSIIQPIEVDFINFRFDILSMLFISALLVLFVYPFGQNNRQYRQTGKYNVLNLKGGILHRWEAAILFGLYIIYIWIII